VINMSIFLGETQIEKEHRLGLKKNKVRTEVIAIVSKTANSKEEAFEKTKEHWVKLYKNDLGKFLDSTMVN